MGILLLLAVNFHPNDMTADEGIGAVHPTQPAKRVVPHEAWHPQGSEGFVKGWSNYIRRTDGTTHTLLMMGVTDVIITN